MTAEPITQLAPRKRCYTLEDSLVFAEISGDHNPLHIDPLVARRTTFRKPVVHGIHLVDVTNAEHFVWKRVSNEQLSLFYFATPAITRSAECFSINKFQNFIDYYVVGLNNLLEKVRVANLFAPSTIFLDHPVKGMAEYAAAKAASEVFCQSIESRYGGMRVATPRWL